MLNDLLIFAKIVVPLLQPQLSPQPLNLNFVGNCDKNCE